MHMPSRSKLQEEWPIEPSSSAQREIDFLRGSGADVALATTALNLLFCTLAGDAFASMGFLGRDRPFTVMLATLLLPATFRQGAHGHGDGLTGVDE
jgi:ABC-type glycerol-3-phosphate transport system permease component